MIKKILFAVVLSMALFTVRAQKLGVQWAGKDNYVHHNAGDVKIIGENSNYFYVKHYQFDADATWIQAYDKNTFQNKLDVKLVGRGTEVDRENDKIVEAFVSEDEIYIFWLRIVKNTKELWSEILTADLKVKQARRKMFVIPKDSKETYNANYFALYNEKAPGGKFVVGYQDVDVEKKTITVKLNQLDNTLSVINKHDQLLPLESFPLVEEMDFSKYKLGDDGKVYIFSYDGWFYGGRGYMTNDPLKCFDILSIVDFSKEKASVFTLEIEGLSVENVRLFSTPEGMRLYGFYSDLEKDKTGQLIDGIYYAELDAATDKISKVETKPFGNEFLDKLTENDLDRKLYEKEVLSSGGKLNGELPWRENPKERESHFDIAELRITDNGKVLLFCDRIKMTVMQSVANTMRGTYVLTTRSDDVAGDIMVFELNKGTAAISNGVCLERESTLGLFNDSGDIKVFKQNGNYLLVYDNMYDGLDKKGKDKIRRDKLRTSIQDWAVYNPDTHTITPYKTDLAENWKGKAEDRQFDLMIGRQLKDAYYFRRGSYLGKVLATE